MYVYSSILLCLHTDTKLAWYVYYFYVTVSIIREVLLYTSITQEQKTTSCQKCIASKRQDLYYSKIKFHQEVNKQKDSPWLMICTHYLILVIRFLDTSLVFFHQLPHRRFMVTVNQNFQVNTHCWSFYSFPYRFCLKPFKLDFGSLCFLSAHRPNIPLLSVTRWFFLPFKALFLVDMYAGEKKYYTLMLRVKLSKYLTPSLADSGNISFHIYASPAIKKILEINVCILQFLCVSQLKSSALHCQTVKCAAQQHCINT